MGETTKEVDSYNRISLPDDLIACVDKAISKSKLGFRSRAEYVAYALRKELSKEEILNGR